MIIGINGYAGSGKDTVGKIIQYLSVGADKANISLGKWDGQPVWGTEDNPFHTTTWEVKKWAGKLKTIAFLLTGIPIEQFEDQEFKKTQLGPEWDRIEYDYFRGMYTNPHTVSMTVRDFLQRLGTDGLRNGLHHNTWVNALMADYKPVRKQWADGPLGGFEDGDLPNWIITDTRFENEANAIRDHGGIIIRVDRPGVKPINGHPSEIGLDFYDFDYVITNDGTLEDLVDMVREVLSQAGILVHENDTAKN